MSKNADGERRVSAEQRRIFRSARLEFVPIGRVAGIEPAAAEVLREWDLAPTGLIQCQDWTEAGLHALMLVRPLVVVGSTDGAGALHWLANGEVLLAMQGRWPSRAGVSDMEHLLLSDLVIVDEAHNFRSVGARRTTVLRDLLRLQPRKDLRRKVLLLTATPVNNSLEDLRQQAALMFGSRP